MHSKIALSSQDLSRLVGSPDTLEDLAEEDPGQTARADGDAFGARTGPLGLMLAVLEDAIRCIALRPINKREHVAVQARHAIRWVRSDDWTYVFSFNNVCTALDIDPPTMRRRLLDEPLELGPAPMRLRRVENRPRRKRRSRGGGAQTAA